LATRDELRELARLRLREAEALFDAELYDGCVYLCGYVVELALKARICTLLGVEDFPDKRIPQAFKTHEFEHLRLLAGLENYISPKNEELFKNWSAATDWKPEWRYRKAGTISREQAREVLQAVRSEPYGVFTWLRQQW
jgi:HEPN domain-containing protein